MVRTPRVAETFTIPSAESPAADLRRAELAFQREFAIYRHNAERTRGFCQPHPALRAALTRLERAEEAAGIALVKEPS